MPFIDTKYADGDVKGFGLVLPHHLTLSERRQILQALGKTKELIMPGFGRWQVSPITDIELIKSSLRDSYYTGVSRLWATVTPIVLDRFPTRLDSEETGQIIALACD